MRDSTRLWRDQLWGDFESRIYIYRARFLQRRCHNEGHRCKLQLSREVELSPERKQDHKIQLDAEGALLLGNALEPLVASAGQRKL